VDISKLLEAANERLRAARTGVTIEARGKNENLYLRGTFPPKVGSGRSRPYRQRICLDMPGTPKTIKLAEAQAKLIGAELNLGQFDWGKWRGGGYGSRKTFADWVEEFETDYWANNKRTLASETTWKGNYFKVYRKLPEDADLTLELLIDWTRKTPADSSDRRRTAQALKRLAKFAKLEGWEVLTKLEGKYSPRTVNPRDLPSDELILRWRQTTVEKYPQWAWIYGMLAVYGLRNHEVFHCDLVDFPDVRISDRVKNKRSRIVYPLYPQWAEEWELAKRMMPPLELPDDLSQISNVKLGDKVTGFFENRSIPFRAYDLRHSFARRCFEFDIPPEEAARLMGHSVEIHRRTYRAWIDEATHKAKYQQRISRPDAPKPPNLTEGDSAD
jgi:integrase